MSGREIQLTPEVVRVLAALHGTAGMDYINEKQLARHLKMSVKEVQHHLKCSVFGLAHEGG
jgi:hypothetical protein